MTLREKQVVSAHTGVLMCKFSAFHEYVEEILERPVFTHEMAFDYVQNEIKEKSKAEFLKICGQEDEE